MGRNPREGLWKVPFSYNGSCVKYNTRDSPKQTSKSGDRLFQATLDAIEQTPEAQAIIHEILTLRHRARPGYPPRSMLRAFCLKFLLNGRFIVGLIRRLQDSAKLREMCGFEDSVPSETVFSRFFKHLSDRASLLEGSIASIVNCLHNHLPDMGDITAIDSTDIEAYANPNRSAVIDQDAAWGHRTTKSKSSSKKDTEPFFGYKGTRPRRCRLWRASSLRSTASEQERLSAVAACRQGSPAGPFVAEAEVSRGRSRIRLGGKS